ncbi:LIC_12097 family sensor histidine kinase [Leptospira sp. GIMC2001]|uniref:LIC_12097 family sensor histidine kinase n=1 Tax=Leptospira sp. GIMC2001 TaxID=1513297 RepID=UPI00234AE96D|nr:HAMP domain-containing sensor histidine kinase [Leptospira sp. GIMC2001]WCL48301.1 HAMP domain-containing sensor histidine kinase [Leptospira sp. GIMC2001]
MEPSSINYQEKVIELESLLDGISDPLFQIGLDFRIKIANKSTKDFSNQNYPLMNQLCYEAIYGREEICPYCPMLEGNSTIPMEKVFTKKNNGKFLSKSREILFKKKERTQNLYIDFFPVEKNGILTSIVEKISDITSIKEKEEESLRMRNLASIGILVSGVAHELNNPLTGISLTLQNLQNSLKTSSIEFIEKRLEMIRNDASRAAMIVSEIISFAKSDKLKVSQGDICETITKARENVVRLYPVLSKNIEWQLEFENHYLLPFNPFKLERVFLNIFRNSLQAFDYRKGFIRIEVRKTKNMLHVIIEDNAGGIPQKIIDKIFDPFYSNNKQSNGTGLGLSICYSIIKEHNGNIIVKSYEDRTRFTISIPYPSKLDS